MHQLRQGLYFGAIRVVRWLWSHPQRAVRLPMHVGGFTAQRTDEPNCQQKLGGTNVKRWVAPMSNDSLRGESPNAWPKRVHRFLKLSFDTLAL